MCLAQQDLTVPLERSVSAFDLGLDRGPWHMAPGSPSAWEADRAGGFAKVGAGVCVWVIPLVPFGRCAFSLVTNYLEWMILTEVGTPLLLLPSLQLGPNRWWREQGWASLCGCQGAVCHWGIYALPGARTQTEQVVQ
jgi:hypothetical protein